MSRNDIRIGLPSKGVLRDATLEFLAGCGLAVHRPNPRQYVASIPTLPGTTVLFQRPGDIVTGVTQGSLDFGITGYDMLREKVASEQSVVDLHEALGFGACTLSLAVPETTAVKNMAGLRSWALQLKEDGRALRVATKFPRLTRHKLEAQGIDHFRLIGAEGTLEIAPAIGFADLIADLVSSGVTLRDNHLRVLDDGEILDSQACLIANRQALLARQEVLNIARQLLELVEATLRAQASYQVTANMRGTSPEALAHKMFAAPNLGGLQGPTVSPVVARPDLERHQGWYAVNIIVRKDDLFAAIAELRRIGGSGVIVTPCAYIFEEEPWRYRRLLDLLSENPPQHRENSLPVLLEKSP